MSEALSNADRALCRSLAHALRASRAPAALGLLCTGLASAWLLLGPDAVWRPAWGWPAAGVLVCLGGLERWWAWRLALDAGLFADLGGVPGFELLTLDQSLRQLGWLAPAALPRPLAERVAGTRRLMRRHAAVVAAQLVLLLALALSAWFV